MTCDAVLLLITAMIRMLLDKSFSGYPFYGGPASQCKITKHKLFSVTRHPKLSHKETYCTCFIWFRLYGKNNVPKNTLSTSHDLMNEFGQSGFWATEIVIIGGCRPRLMLLFYSILCFFSSRHIFTCISCMTLTPLSMSCTLSDQRSVGSRNCSIFMFTNCFVLTTNE